MELKFEELSLSDLITIKGIIEERLKKKIRWVDAERGKNYDEYNNRHKIFLEDENHQKLKRINNRIEEFIKII